MKEAICRQCKETKPLSAFYKSQYSRISGLGQCAECTKSRVRANRLAKIDYYREYDRARGSRMDAGRMRKYRQDNQAKYKAQNAVNNAVRDGRMEKPRSCEECGSGFSLHGHHDDYSKPLEVRWLCAACHHQWHAKHGEAKNGRAAV